MNLRLVRLRSVGLASVSLFEPDDPYPCHARVVDLAVGVIVRRMALGPSDHTSSRLTAAISGTSSQAGQLDAARLDALIAFVERGRAGGPYECGGA